MGSEAILDWLARQPIPPEELPAARRIVRRFRNDFGVWPELAPPRRYIEWILHRMIFDRDPRLPVLADKVGMRAHARAVLGQDMTVPPLQVHDSAEAIDWDSLPPAFYLKASHGSGWNIRVQAHQRPDRAAITAQLKAWLGSCMWRDRMEWGYRDIPPRVIAEPLLRLPGHRKPHEICIYCFGGVVQYIRVNRFPPGAETLSGCFDVAMRPLALYAKPSPAACPEGIDPAPLLEAARRLSAGLVYLRVDFLVAEGRAWLCELTNYPGGGRTISFRDQAAELLLGELYAAAHHGAAQPCQLDARIHFTDPPGTGGLTARTGQA
jgi:hypothetical protein